MSFYFPVVGSQWKHHVNDITYTVTAIANIPATGTYPTTVVYTGPNGKVWAKTIENFLTTMRQV